MLESMTPDPTQEELAAIISALSRRANGGATDVGEWKLGTHDPDADYDALRSAARARTRRLR